MKLQFTVVVLASLLGLSSPALAHDPKAHAAKPAPQLDEQTKPAIAVVDAFSAALHAVDLERVSKLLADDVLVLESGGAERSREEYFEHHALADAMFLKSAHSQITHRTARVDGPIAWVGTESELHTSKDGKPMTLLSTETMVLKKTGADWRIVHIHWSSRPKKAAEAPKAAPAASSAPATAP